MPTRNEFESYAIKHLGIDSFTLYDYLNKTEKHTKNMTRSVIEERPKPFREIDVFSRLIMNRIIFLGTDINDTVSNIIIAQLLFLESVGPEQEVTLYINSPGGGIYAGLGIYDTIQYVSFPLGTACVGLAASMAAVLLASGCPGKRVSLPHSRIMIHQPLGRAEGQMEDMKITIKQVEGLGSDLYNILAKHTGQSFDQIKEDANRDFWFKSDEAKAYGLIDHVLMHNKICPPAEAS